MTSVSQTSILSLSKDAALDKPSPFDKLRVTIARMRRRAGPGQLDQSFKIAMYERFFLSPRPALDLPLAQERLVLRWKLLRIDQLDRQATAGVGTPFARLMLSQTQGQVVGRASIVGAIRAPEE